MDTSNAAMAKDNAVVITKDNKKYLVTQTPFEVYRRSLSAMLDRYLADELGYVLATDGMVHLTGLGHPGPHFVEIVLELSEIKDILPLTPAAA